MKEESLALKISTRMIIIIIDIIICTTSGDSHRVAPEGAAGSRRERNSDVKVLHYRSIEMLESLVALCDYRPTRKQENVRGRRLALRITALRSPPMHRRTAFFDLLEVKEGDTAVDKNLGV